MVAQLLIEPAESERMNALLFAPSGQQQCTART
jgi:hypothetical protein